VTREKFDEAVGERFGFEGQCFALQLPQHFRLDSVEMVQRALLVGVQLAPQVTVVVFGFGEESPPHLRQ